MVINVRANDADLDGDPIAVTGVGASVDGTTGFTGSAALFTPGAGYNGNTSFTYSIGDGFGGSATGNVTLTNVPPGCCVRHG
jgi:hypothetical protein